MEHHKLGLKVLLLLAMGVTFTAGVYGQSLADLARKTRSRTSGGKVLTNDDVKTSAPPPAPAATAAAAGATKAGGGVPAGAAGKAAAGKEGQAAAGAATAEKSQEELEKEYRAKFKELRDNLALEETKLDVMQRELNLMQNQYYQDPYATLMQEQTRSNINKRTAEIETQKGVVEKAKQAIADLEEELRVKGLPAGWAR